MNADGYFDGLNSPVKEIAIALRKIITAYSAELIEEIKWNVPTYHIETNICSIIAHKSHVNFQLMQGAHLKDAQQLQGTGTNMRHMKFTSLSEIDKEKIENILQQAIELGR